MNGYIKDHRKELDSDIWMMPPLYHRTWQWLKYNVNHEPADIPMRDGSKLFIKKGQRLTSIRDMAKAIGWYEGTKWKEPNPKTISVILDWMIKQGMISIERGQGNRQYTLITLLNWDVYNPKEIQGNSKVTAEKHLADINNNDNNSLSTTTTSEPSISALCRMVFGLNIIPPLVTDYLLELRGKGFTDSFLRELLLETGESAKGGVASTRFFKTIGERWEKERIFTRQQAMQGKENKPKHVYTSTSEKEASLQNRQAEERKRAVFIPLDLPPEFNHVKEVAAAYDVNDKPTGTV